MTTIATGVQEALAKIEADGKSYAAVVARDAARQVTVTVDFTDRFGDELTITATGIAPFQTVPARRLTTAEGWRVVGQKSLAPQPIKAVLHNGPKCLRGELWGGLPLLNEADARRLADILNAQIRKAA